MNTSCESLQRAGLPRTVRRPRIQAIEAGQQVAPFVGRPRSGAPERHARIGTDGAEVDAVNRTLGAGEELIAQRAQRLVAGPAGRC